MNALVHLVILAFRYVDKNFFCFYDERNTTLRTDRLGMKWITNIGEVVSYLFVLLLTRELLSVRWQDKYDETPNNLLKWILELVNIG